MPDIRLMMNEELDRLRRTEARNRVTCRRMWKSAAAIAGGVTLLILLDVGFTPIFDADAVVQTKVDTWTVKHGNRCVTYLDTSLGKASITDIGTCARPPWKVGERFKVAARIGRLSGRISVMRDYGKIALPHIDTAGGVDILPGRDYRQNPPARALASPRTSRATTVD